MSHNAGSGHDGGHHGESGGSFHYAVGDNYNPLGSYSDIYKLEHLTDGLRINNGIRFALLFISFFGWLYVVYWLRHHEPLSQQSIGANSSYAPTANQDKSIVASARNAFPLKTSSEFGTLYCPSPKTSNPIKSEQQSTTIESQAKPSVVQLKVHPGAAISAPVNYSDITFDQRFGSPANPQSLPNPSSVSEPILSNSSLASSYQSSYGQPNIKTAYNRYDVAVKNGAATTVRTVVNR